LEIEVFSSAGKGLGRSFRETDEFSITSELYECFRCEVLKTSTNVEWLEVFKNLCKMSQTAEPSEILRKC
jgi:hypothetical protein